VLEVGGGVGVELAVVRLLRPGVEALQRSGQGPPAHLPERGAHLRGGVVFTELVERVDVEDGLDGLLGVGRTFEGEQAQGS